MNLNFEEEKKKERRKAVIKECIIWLIEVIIVIVLAWLLVHFCIKKSSTIGSVMEPTLYNGEEVFINTKAYMLFSPKREDVIAFYDKEGASDEGEEPLITFRRIIGLPGETVQITDGKIQINGKALQEKHTYQPMLTAGVAEQPVKLGEDEYFVLCDSRVDSDDSRNSSFGNVKREQILGKVMFRIKPFSIVSGPDRGGMGTAAASPSPSPG